MTHWIRRALQLRIISHLLFWSWNAIFIAVVCFGLVPTVLWPLAREAADGFVPIQFFMAALLVVLVPVAVTTAGIMALRGDPRRLLELFYGFEAPVFALALARLFLVRQLTPALGFVLCAFGVATSVYVHGIHRREPPTRALLHQLRYMGEIVGLGCALYLGTLVAFFALPAAASLATWLWGDVLSLRFWSGLFHSLLTSHFAWMAVLCAGVLLLALYSATLFVAMPFAYVVLAAQRYAEGHSRFAARFGRPAAIGLSLGVLGAFTGVLAILDRQPQQRAFAVLETPPATDGERRARLADSEELRAGLTNAYLSRYRYLGSVAEAALIRDLYQHEFHLERAGAETVQSLFNVFAGPVEYQSLSRSGDQDKAAELYARFFDQPIQKGEQSTILSALESTYETSAREAGLIDAGERKVHLASQELEITESDGQAAIELHEVYENQTQEEQEVFYYFSLPTTSVVTGLWLGDSDDRTRRFEYQVSPRGAAQKVYRQQVTRRVDPALVEQVGPGQYRLRAFPVPRRGADWSDAWRHGNPGGAKALHLWLKYRALPEQGHWPLPSLSEKRNVYWDRATHRRWKGTSAQWPQDRWLPAYATIEALPERRSHLVVFHSGGAGTVDAAIAMEPATAEDLSPAAPRGKAYAIVIDRSRSMAACASERTAMLGWLAAHVFADNDADLYLTASAARGEPPTFVDDPSRFDPGAIIDYGGQNPGDLLRQFDGLRPKRRYDAVIVLTDAGSLDLATDEPRAPVTVEGDRPVPIWMVHLGGVLPAGYDDATLSAIQKSGGGATTDIKDVFVHLALSEERPGFIEIGGGYVFRQVAPPPAAPVPTDEDPMSVFAARQWVAAEVRALSSDRDPAQLDRLHAVAKRAHFVSPWSSMIVLVSDEQREALRKAERDPDRFDRKVESGIKALPGPSNLGSLGAIEGTPEPGEWALLAVILIGAAATMRRRASAQLS